MCQANVMCSDKEFSSLPALRKHRTTVHNDTVFSCNDCTKRFTAQKNLKAHIKTIHDMKQSNCSVCDKSFGANLKRHEIFCRKKYTHNIQQHYVDNFTAKTYSCDQCEKIYNFKSDLIAHRKYHHEKQICHICDKTVKSSLQRHIDLMHKVYNDSGNSFILVRDKTRSKSI